MSLTIRKLIFAVTFNSCLFFLLMIGIQNSSNKRKVNLIFNETIKLPISFVVGMSFISGSIAGSLLTANLSSEKK